MHFAARHPEDATLFVSTDPALLNLDEVHAVLTSSYWSPGISRERVAKAAAHSLTFGLYKSQRVIGYARAITDRASFAYLADVYVLEEFRGKGLGVWFMQTLLAHPDLQGLRRICLMTRDAHALYAKFGFKPMPDPSRFMEIHRPNIYAAPAATP